MYERARPETPRSVLSAAAVREAECGSSELSALIERIAAGEQLALTELYELTVAKLYGLARLILRNSADAEEVVCDTFTQVWQSASRYESGRGTVMGWMLTICRSRALDLLRQRRLRDRLASKEEPPVTHLEGPIQDGPDSLLQALQQGSAVQCALQSLSPVRQRLVTLAFLQGLSHQEIVERTGLPIGTVKSHIRRALSMLRDELRIWDDHAPSF